MKTPIICFFLLLLFITGCAKKTPDINEMDEPTPTTQSAPDSSTIEPKNETLLNEEQGDVGQRNQKLEEQTELDDNIQLSGNDIAKSSNEPISPLEQSESQMTENLDLSQYLHQNINDIIPLFKNMHDDGATDGSVAYSNDAIIICSGLGIDDVEFINIFGDCDYTLLGIEYGMHLSEAQSIAESIGELIPGGRPDIMEYQLNTGNQLSIVSENGFTVSDVSLFAY